MAGEIVTRTRFVAVEFPPDTLSAVEFSGPWFGPDRVSFFTLSAGRHLPLSRVLVLTRKTLQAGRLRTSVFGP